MKVYALTGGIAAGKSEAARRFREKGVPVIDADRIGHEVLEPGGAAEAKVIEAFGPDILTEGRIDRERLGDRVFGDPAALKKLNALVHPAILEEMASRTLVLAQEGHEAIIIEAALHAEDGKLREDMAGLILVQCPREERIRRLMSGREMTKEEAIRRIEAQTPPEQKIPLAKWVIMNDREMEHLREQVDRIVKEL